MRTMLRKTALKRNPTRRLAQSSRLAQSRRQFYSIKPIVWARDESMCVCCSVRASEYHHRQPRGMGGSSRNDTIHSPAAIICLCRPCHARAESERTWAETNGYLVRRGVADPAEVPVHYRGRFAFLDHDGGLLFVTEPTNERHP